MTWLLCSPLLQAVLYVGNVLEDDEEGLLKEMQQFGEVVRCFIARDVEVSC